MKNLIQKAKEKYTEDKQNKLEKEVMEVLEDIDLIEQDIYTSKKMIKFCEQQKLYRENYLGKLNKLIEEKKIQSIEDIGKFNELTFSSILKDLGVEEIKNSAIRFSWE